MLWKVSLQRGIYLSTNGGIQMSAIAHDRLTDLTTQMFLTQTQFHSAKTDHDKNTYQKKIEIIDKQIDDLVYELYGLTKEEIKIVEDSIN